MELYLALFYKTVRLQSSERRKEHKVVSNSLSVLRRWWDGE